VICNKNARPAAEEYTLWFHNRRHASKVVFSIVHQRLQNRGPPTTSYQENWRVEMGSPRAHTCTDHCCRCVLRQCLLVLAPRFPVSTLHHLHLWNERMSLCIGKNRTDDVKSHTLTVRQRPCPFKESSMFCVTTSSPMQEGISNSKPHKLS
jgi:hypothetical protein